MRHGWIGVLALVVVPAAGALGAVQYTVAPIGGAAIGGTFDGGGALAIANTGLVLGQNNDVWSASTGDVNVDASPYVWANTWAINSSGAIAGSVVLPGGASPYGSLPSMQGWGGAAYGTSGQVTLLPALQTGPNAMAEAYGINDNGVVVGMSGNSADQSRKAVRWTNGVAEDLSVYLNPADGSSSASSINNNGQVVMTQGTQSYVLTGTQLTPITASDSSAVATYGGQINNNGQVEGIMYFADGTAESFIWSAGQMKVAPSLFPGNSGVTEFGAINDQGTAVGFYSALGQGNATAIMWDGSGQTVDLNSLIDPNSGWQLYSATGINDSGDIVGNGLLNGQPTAFILTPTTSPSSSPAPEPASAATLGLAGLLLLRRRRGGANRVAESAG